MIRFTARCHCCHFCCRLPLLLLLLLLMRTNMGQVFAPAQAKTLAQAWTTTAQTTNETVESVGKEVRGASEKLNELAASANGSLDKVRAAGEELAKTLEAVNSGKGTLGQLVNNPDLYRNLDDAAKRLDKALDEAQQMLEKYKNEGIKIKL